MSIGIPFRRDPITGWGSSLTAQLEISLGQFSDRGRKEINQDFHGALIPDGSARTMKGITMVIADGISSSDVSQIAAETAVKSFLSDYYCTSDAWSVKTSAQRVISAVNSWLHAQSRQAVYGDGLGHERDRGFVCTFSVLVLKSRTAHLFHIGDSRVLRLVGPSLERLTVDHTVHVSSSQTYLARALGMDAQVEIDYRQLPLSVGDVFVLATDGIADYADKATMQRLLAKSTDLDEVARGLASHALESGSRDNLTVQVVRIESLPGAEAEEGGSLSNALSPPGIPEPGMEFEGWKIIRRLHGSDRSHVFEAVDVVSGVRVALKIPAVSVHEDAVFLRRFMMEEWVARRVSHPHVLRAVVPDRPRRFLYTTMELVEGRSLSRWMQDNPNPPVSVVQAIVSQIGAGLQAMHRRQMLHQDLRPENILIDAAGHVTLIDFGSAWVAGVEELTAVSANPLPGTQQYMAPEYLLGESGTAASDLFSLGIITYQMLAGQLPYSAAMAQATSRAAQRRAAYVPLVGEDSEVPLFVDAALRKAVHFDPAKRQQEVAEFIADLSRLNPSLPGLERSALAERDPVVFWKSISLFLFITVTALIGWLATHTH